MSVSVLQVSTDISVNMHVLLASMVIVANFCVTVVPMHLVTLKLADVFVLQDTRDSDVRESVNRANSGLIVSTDVTVMETPRVTLSVAGVCVHLEKRALAVTQPVE